MGKIFLAGIIAATALRTISRPYIGSVAYYLLAVLGPQYIWWWDFEGLRVSLWVAIATFCGFIGKLSNDQIQFTYLKTKINFWLLLLWICITISYFFGPYTSASLIQRAAITFSPARLFHITNNIFLFYFVTTCLIDDIQKLRHLIWVLIGATLYLTYWANAQYFSQNWYQFLI